MLNRKSYIYTIVLIFCVGIVVTGCTEKTTWRSWESTQGEQLRWKPVAPQIGDLVSMEAFIPEIETNASDENSLWDASGIRIVPVLIDYLPDGRKIHYSFRITQKGTWLWGTSNKKQILWAAQTIASDASEIKVLDAQGLWSGKKAKK